MTSFPTDPCSPIAAFVDKLPEGMWLNLLVTNLPEAVAFQSQVIGSDVIYEDTSFALLQYSKTVWLLHTDHSYARHPVYGTLQQSHPRGMGCELRVFDRDPDRAVQEACKFRAQILQPAQDKPHMLREAFIKDSNGYIWVPCKCLDSLRPQSN